MRSILFLPLDKIERVPKALGSNADKVIFDLEDGLAKDKKDFGRENFIEFSKTNFDNQPQKFLLRINGLDTNDYHQPRNFNYSNPGYGNEGKKETQYLTYA